jgi:ribonuclease BN (tRNA processing enzyme)
LTTTFRLHGGILVDVGAAAHALSVEERAGLSHILLSHAHLDHTMGLPFLLAECEPVVYGLKETLDAVRECLFDGRIWPDLRQRATWKEIRPGDALTIGDVEFAVGASSHTVPCLSFGIMAKNRVVALVGDTRLDEEVVAWTAGLEPDFCVVEASYPDAHYEVAQRYGHQSPRDLPAWRDALGEACTICVTHIKPAHLDAVRAECRALGDPRLRILQDGDVIIQD